MNILDDLASICGLADGGFDFYFTGAGSKTVAFSGDLQVNSFSSEEIVLKVGKKKIVVSGERLRISSLSPKEIGIAGEIESIAFGSGYGQKI